MNSHVREDARKNNHVREDARNLRLLDSTMEYMFNRKIMKEWMHWFVPTQLLNLHQDTSMSVRTRAEKWYNPVYVTNPHTEDRMEVRKS